jgi:hypothetical protein
LAHNAAVRLTGRKILMREEERQGKEVHNTKEAVGSSE